METSLGKSSVSWNSDLNEFISDSHAHLAATLHDYRATLSLVYIPKNARTASDTKPWAILDSSPTLPQHIIRYLSDAEMSNPSEVLSWVFKGDLVRHGKNNVLARIEAEQAAAELLNLKRQEEELEDRIDHMAFLVSGGRERKSRIQVRRGEWVNR
jgi:hypothetical protein